MAIKIERITGIARSLNFKYPTNRAIIIIVASAFLLGTLVQVLLDSTFSESIIWAFGAAGSVFFSWALARELDPDHNASAFISVAFVVPTLFFANLPTLLVLVWFLVIIRILNRITGITPTLLDLVVIIVLAVVLSWQVMWLYGLLTSLVLYVNQSMDGKGKQCVLLSMIIIPLVILSILLGNTDLVTVEMSSGTTIATAAITLLFIPVIFLTDTVQSLTDVTGELVPTFRLRIARTIAVVTGSLVVITQGNHGFYDLLPLWSAITGVILNFLYRKLIGLRVP